MRPYILSMLIVAAVPMAASAQGLVGGAERGARQGEIEAGPVGEVVGGAVSAAVGTVDGALGVDPRLGCESVTTRRTDGAGDTEVVKRTNCP